MMIAIPCSHVKAGSGHIASGWNPTSPMFGKIEARMCAKCTIAVGEYIRQQKLAQEVIQTSGLFELR